LCKVYIAMPGCHSDPTLNSILVLYEFFLINKLI
jgi:hypothetical protein